MGARLCYCCWYVGILKETNVVDFDIQVRAFVTNGGNYFGQCAGVSTYENCGDRDPTHTLIFGTDTTMGQCPGLFLTDHGLITDSRGKKSGAIHYRVPWAAFAQTDSFSPTGGSISEMALKKYAS